MVKVLVPSGALGLNYDKAALARGVAAKPDIIAIDGGSTDSGPYYLGTGSSKYARASTKVEWRGLMQARDEARVPLVIGSAGTCGTDSAVDWLLDITRDVATELGQHLKIAVLRSSQNPDLMAAAWEAGRISPLSNAPDITADTLRNCSNIVALAGVEQISKALETGADIIIAGRTTDTATIAALPIMRGISPAAAWHGAKIGECGALCATNPQSGVLMLDFQKKGFTVTPMATSSRATPYTVSAHMLYENSDPFVMVEPGGQLDVRHATYRAVNEREVAVTGAKWQVAKRYTVKLEGAMRAGYQLASLVLLRDPHYVQNARAWATDIEQKCAQKAQDRLGLEADDFSIELRLIGQNASFGALETQTGTPIETGVLAIVTAQQHETAKEIAKMLNPYLLHHPLSQAEEQPSFAFAFSPPEMDRGAVYNFCLNHVLALKDPMDAFTLEVISHG